MRYDAFLSYSHGANQRLSAAIEVTLEALGKRWDERRALLVFRDVSKQSATHDLAGDLLARLDASRFLVLLASPEAARSEWVGQEVRHWLRTKGLGSLLLAHVGGELVWDDAAARFDPARTDALPAVLLEAYAAEPKWVDFRWACGEEGLGPEHERFADSVADLSAAIQGRAKDEIVGTQLREHRKALARRVAQQASVFVGYQPELGLLLAAAADELSSSPDTRRALLGALEETADLGAVLGTDGRVTSIALDAAGTTLLAGLADGAVEEWDAERAARRRSFRLGPSSAVTALAFGPGGSAFAAGFADSVVAVASRDGRVLVTGQARARPQRVALDDRQGFLASAGEASDPPVLSVEVWGLKSGTHVVPYSAEYGLLNYICFDPQGRFLKVFEQNTIITFDALNGAELRRRELPFYLRPGPKACTPDGRVGVYTSFDGGVVALYDTDTWEETKEENALADEYEGVTYGVGLSPSADAAAVVANRRLTVMDTSGERPAVECVGLPPGEVELGVTNGGRAVAVLGGGRAQLHLPGRKSRLGLSLMEGVEPPSVISGVGDAAFGPEGSLLAWVAAPAAAADEVMRPGRPPGETVAVWDCAERRWAASVPSGSAYQICFDGDGRLVVLSLEGVVSAWDVKSGRQTSSAARLSGGAISGGTVRLWCPAGGRPLLFAHAAGRTELYGALDAGGPVWSRPPAESGNVIRVATSRGARFALADDAGRVEVWDFGAPPVYTTRVTNPYLTNIVLSGDGRLLAVWEPGGNLAVHDVEAATVLADFAVVELADAAFSADARLLFVLASDGRITLHELPGGLIVGALQGMAGATWGQLRAGRDSRRLAELAAGGALTLWDVDPASWRAAARNVAGRELTDPEKTRFHLG